MQMMSTVTNQYDLSHVMCLARSDVDGISLRKGKEAPTCIPIYISYHLPSSNLGSGRWSSQGWLWC